MDILPEHVGMWVFNQKTGTAATITSVPIHPGGDLVMRYEYGSISLWAPENVLCVSLTKEGALAAGWSMAAAAREPNPHAGRENLAPEAAAILDAEFSKRRDAVSGAIRKSFAAMAHRAICDHESQGTAAEHPSASGYQWIGPINAEPAPDRSILEGILGGPIVPGQTRGVRIIRGPSPVCTQEGKPSEAKACRPPNADDLCVFREALESVCAEYPKVTLVTDWIPKYRTLLALVDVAGVTQEFCVAYWDSPKAVLANEFRVWLNGHMRAAGPGFFKWAPICS